MGFDQGLFTFEQFYEANWEQVLEKWLESNQTVPKLNQIKIDFTNNTSSTNFKVDDSSHYHSIINPVKESFLNHFKK